MFKFPLSWVFKKSIKTRQNSQNDAQHIRKEVENYQRDKECDKESAVVSTYPFDIKSHRS